jgi:hypothetical protein
MSPVLLRSSATSFCDNPVASDTALMASFSAMPISIWIKLPLDQINNFANEICRRLLEKV